MIHVAIVAATKLHRSSRHVSTAITTTQYDCNLTALPSIGATEEEEDPFPAHKAIQTRLLYLQVRPSLFSSPFSCSTRSRQRRIKCDEERPSCLRCQRSGRICAGYPPNPVQAQDDSFSNSSTPSSNATDRTDESWRKSFLTPAINATPWSPSHQRRFLDLGFTVLGSDPFQIYSQSDLAVFSCLLPQLGQLSPSVSAAASAFGAAYDASILHDGDSLVSEHSDHQYGLALRLLQLELTRPEPQYAPLVMASTLLAAAETLQARQKGALAHVLGAFGIFASRNQRQLTASDPGSHPKPNNGGLAPEIITMLENLCLSIDLQVATFTWGQRPNLPPQVFTDATFNPQTIDELRQEQPKIIHACLHFIAEASQEIFKEYSELPFSLVVKQGQMISWLRKWLGSFSDLVETNEAFFHGHCDADLSGVRERNLRLLKAQTLSTLIAVSNIRTASQTGYDRYASEFEEIVQCAEIVLRGARSYSPSSTEPSPYSSSFPPSSTSSPPPSTPHPNLLPFSASPGIIQPLFFTARKYRHSLTRRAAISLLRLSGFEGPFCGDFEADLATRFVEIEEARPFKMSLPASKVLKPQDIPDWRRICSCWRLSEKDDLDERIVKFCRRRQARWPADEDDERDVFNLSNPNARTSEDDRWETWDETLRSFKRHPHSDCHNPITGEHNSHHHNSHLPAEDLTHKSWVPLSCEAKCLGQLQTPLQTSFDLRRLPRDPDWVKSAVGSGEYFGYMDPKGEHTGDDWGQRALDEED